MESGAGLGEYIISSIHFWIPGFLYGFWGGERGTMMSLPLKIKLALVQLASDGQNGNTFVRDCFHFQDFSFRVSLLVISWLLHESPGRRGTLIQLHLHNQQRGHQKRLKPLSGRQDVISNQLGNLRWAFSFFFYNLLVESTWACLLMNYSEIFTF